MGLSSKQVSSRGVDWNQTLLQDQNLELPKPPLMRKLQQQSQQSSSSSEALKCPRCDSTNTKFCYYNNYNKSQPRHFCRTCKRHWTKGGTLRNVPVGGGRKNKRVKKSTTPTSAAAAVASTSAATAGGGGLNNTHMRIPNQNPLHQRQSTTTTTTTLPLPSSSSSSASLYQALLRPPPPHPQPSLLPQQNLMGTNNNNGGNGSSFLSSTTLPLVHQNQNFLFPFSSSTSFETNPCSVSTSLRSSNNNVYSYGEDLKTMEEPTLTTTTQAHPWENMPSTSVGNMGGMSSYWSWEDIDSLVSTDLNVPWDDSDLKP